MPDDSRLKPEFAVHLDGNRLQGEEAAAILGIRVFQTRSGASAFEIIVSDPDLAWQGKPTFTDCKEVKIELGVPGKLKKIFDGEVTAWRTELERAGPTVLVLRGMDRSHRMMRAKKTKTYAGASPLDCAKQIAGQYGLTAKTRPGSPDPVKMFRFQANQTDYEFLSSMAELEGYMFWVEGSELHFERPELSDDSDVEFSFGEDLKTFQPVANFRKPPASVEVGAWDTSGKSEITGKAKTGDELWSVPGGKPGSKVAKFTSTKPELSLVESRVGTQEHADTVAKAALTRRAMEFITAEVEVQGNPAVKPGAMVNLKKVGAYSGHYLVTEANHFYDGAGYNCIFYVARDKWGDSSSEKEKGKSAKQTSGAGKQQQKPYKPATPKQGAGAGKNEPIDFTLQDDAGNALAGIEVKVRLASGEVIEATTDDEGHVHIDDKPPGPYTVEIPEGLALTTIHLQVQDADGNPVSGAPGTVTLDDGAEIKVMTDSAGEVVLTDVPAGEYTFKLDEEAGGVEAKGPAPEGEPPAGKSEPPADEPEPPADEAEPAAGEEKEGEEQKDDGGEKKEDEEKKALVIEVEDAHFRFDSAVFLPEPAADTGADAPPPDTIAGLDVLKTIYLRLKEFPDEKLLVAGHTDTKGADAYNLPLSEKRAAAVEALLGGDDGAFAKISQAQHQPKD
ncbi:MAG: contractile injection system protein, VgrG/Pvc8 family, partial [Myxococcales bacterium]